MRRPAPESFATWYINAFDNADRWMALFGDFDVYMDAVDSDVEAAIQQRVEWARRLNAGDEDRL